MDELSIAEMTVDEALEWKARVKTHANSLRILINDGYERQAWKALGFKNWTECVKSIAQEFSLSDRYIFLLHSANETEKLLNHGSVEIGEIPERQLRPLTPLPPAQQVEVWQQVVDTAPNGRITAAHVQSVVDEFRQVDRPHVSYNSGENEWYTPPEYIEAARRVMGTIDIDPASSEVANRTVQARVYFDKESNGLLPEWDGNIWMNPPYSGDLVGKFCDKLNLEYNEGRTKAAIVLVNNATETGWFQGMLEYASCVCFVKRRVKFLDVNGNPIGAPLQGQAILYFGDDAEAFAREFEIFGKVLHG